MSSNHPTSGPPPLSTLVAISLLRNGFDTSAARHAKDVLQEVPPSAWFRAVAERQTADPADRQENVRWALSGVDSCLQQAAKLKHRALTCLDPDYPPLLREIPDPPVVLWMQGQADILGLPAVAVVGSRDALPASLSIARTLGRELAKAGLVVVSGMARGVDGAAHLGALDETGRTIAVLGSGLGRIYPDEHKPMAARIMESGIVMSELRPYAGPYGRHFPLRNRIISGLCRATVVIEAAKKSGSLITARLALEQNREVLAVPGGPLSGRHRGCHSLIKDGARLVETVEDVLEELKWPYFKAVTAPDAHNHLQLSDLENNMAKGEPYSVDDLAKRTKRSASEILTDLCLFELNGRVVRTTGGRFVRLTGPESREGK